MLGEGEIGGDWKPFSPLLGPVVAWSEEREGGREGEKLERAREGDSEALLSPLACP